MTFRRLTSALVPVFWLAWAAHVSALPISAAATTQPGALAGVHLGIGSGTPDMSGKAAIAVTLTTDGAAVAGTQNDILFDNTVLQLGATDCTLNPALSDVPPGGNPCAPINPIGPCKQLLRSVVQCGTNPQPFGCPADASSHVSVFHGFVFASFNALNVNPIPDGVLYTCVFTILAPAQLPATLQNQRALASDPAGTITSVTATDGQILPLPTATPTQTSTVTNTPTATPTFTHSPSATATRTSTPVPTVTATATRTGTSTRTPTVTLTPSPSGTPTRTSTPLPTATATRTGTFTPTATPTSTFTPTGTPTHTFTPMPTGTPSTTWTPAASSTQTASATSTVPFTSTPTRTATATPTPPSGMPSDGNCDGLITAADLPAVIDALGLSVLPCTGLDANGDGRITPEDVGLTAEEIFNAPK